MPLLPHRPDRYLRTAKLALDSGRPVLRAVAWEPGGERVLTVRLGADGSPAEESAGDVLPAVVAFDGAGRPTASFDEHRAEDAGWSVCIERRGYVSSVVATLPSGRTVTVWEAHATASAPAVHVANGGAWVAFHHNLREDRVEADLAKWIALRFVDDDGRVFAPAAPMTDRDRDREGEEQSFEFPSLAVGADGAVAIFGRGSHQFWRQDASANGFDSRAPLGDGVWGCRGRRVSVIQLGDGTLLTARREKQGIDITPMPAPTGGAPRLAPADVVPGSHAPSVEIPSASLDPALRDGRRTLFGDVHQYSAHSDGIGAADEPYLRARYVYGDDFCALTDHESFIGKRIGEGEWAQLCAVAERHDEPGAFATLLAYEWTGRMYPGPGHKVVYLPPEGGPIVSRDDVPEGAELVRRVAALGGFAVPHHVGWTGADEDAHDPEGQPVWEICSCHGCYLTADHPLGGRGDLRDQMVEEVMRRGRRFGFIACSDGHGLLYHHGVGRKRDPFRCGLTAVQAEDCTREAILRAIRERRCYATSGVPILLDLRAAGAPMGSELSIDGPVEVRAEAACATDVRSLALIGPEGVIASVDGAGREATVEARVGGGWVYARVEQLDGEMAWSSPIFLDRP
ncbi:MAG: DUF3604 domain-containing protein [Myxococcales bacterium]|nr:DUF3604 domain-containing protein [Myxococcales bacterium]